MARQRSAGFYQHRHVLRKVGDEVILSPRPSDWRAFLESGVRASADFMAGIDDLPVHERSFR